MRLATPKFQHPPELYAAIIQEHGGDALQMARRLQSHNWSLADAAWATVHWDLSTLAAAIAAARDARQEIPPTLPAASAERSREAEHS